MFLLKLSAPIVEALLFFDKSFGLVGTARGQHCRRLIQCAQNVSVNVRQRRLIRRLKHAVFDRQLEQIIAKVLTQGVSSNLRVDPVEAGSEEVEAEV